ILWSTGQLERAAACTLCGSAQTHPLVERPDKLPLHECAACRFAFLALRPSAAALAGIYDGAYFQESETYQDYFNYAEAMADLNYCPRLHRLRPWLHEWRGRRVLDVGCAAGGTLVILRGQGARVQGIELSAAACCVAREKFGLELFQGRLEDAPLPRETLDAILMFDVLEHLPEPGRALERLLAALVPGGHLALTVPNFDCFDREGTAWRGLTGFQEHLNYFRAEVLRHGLEARGAQVLETHTYTTGTGPPPTLARRRLVRSLRDKLPWLNRPFRALRKLRFRLRGEPPLDRRVDGSGMDLFVLCRKSRSSP
ncbi:MAG: class I SAM-dependent methyltransferase, partial [Planctomycetota bacterium]